MGRPSKYPDELRERAVRMVAEVRPQYPSQWAAITAVAGMLGIGTPETLRTWIRRSEVDTGQRPGVTPQMAEENKALRKEIAKVRANGVAVDTEEFVPNLCCVSVPVDDGEGRRAIAAISIAMPKMRFKRTLVPHWCDLLRKKSVLISQQLGLIDS